MLPSTTPQTVRFAAASLGDFVRGHVGVVDVQVARRAPRMLSAVGSSFYTRF